MTEEKNSNKDKLAQLKAKYTKKESKLKDTSSMGMRLFSELMAAVLLGLGLGYAVDKYFDTTPWGMIILLILFLAGAVYNMFKSLGQIEYDTSKMDIVPEEEDKDD